MMRIIKTAILLMGVSLLVLFGNDSKGEQRLGQLYSGIIVEKRWDLPEILTEISGLSYIDGDRFACVQDELGTIFVYNTKTSTIEKQVAFGPVGDYEELTIVNDDAWVLRSDGRLFEVNGFNKGNPSVKEFHTPLTAKQNVEGLCYDKTNSRLLVITKDAEPGNVTYKGIYSFDLASRKMAAEPVFKIDLQDKIFGDGTNTRKKSAAIMPSAIAIHPVTRDMYITDGRGSKLLIADAAGRIKKLLLLGSKDFAQPEGITFKPNGEMFISNEGLKQAGNILKVKIDAE